jgi:hypothetical protein
MKKKILVLLLAACLQTLTAIAQNTTGRLTGTVSSPDGVLPGATVTATDQKTGRSLTAVTNESGAFQFPQLEFGDYRVTVSATGFKTFIASDVKIDVGREYTLNPQLEVGQISEEVTVSAGTEEINASNAELSTTISQEQIRDLPLNGRNPLDLINLQAGANRTTNSINGQRSSSTDFRRDGLNVQDNYIRTGGFVQDQPTVDDTGEFTLTTQNAGVEQGGGSSLVQLVTPRGGKDFHGALYAFNRNSAFTANTFYNNERKIARPFLNRNQFGGSISGPLPFFNFGEGGPTFVKDKAFFFFNYEAFRLAQQVTATATTLLPQARTGDFTFTSGGQTRTINVLTGNNFTSPLTTAQGGTLTVDPIIQARILNNLPTEGNGLRTGTNFLQAVSFLRKDPRERNSYTGRFDYDINDRNSFNFVYRRNDDTDARTDLASGFSPVPFVNTMGPTDFFVAAYRTTIGSNFTNEIRGGFQNYSLIFDEGDSVPDDFLIGIPLVTNPEGSFRTQGRDQRYRNLQDNAVYSFGNHSFRFGAQYESYGIVEFYDNGTTPTYSITTTANVNTPGLTAEQICGSNTCINTTDLARANSLRYLLGGIIGSASRTVNLTDIAQGYTFGGAVQPVNYKIYSAYGSDQWRVRPNLTLNLGLRYEYYTPLKIPIPVFLEPVIADPDDIAASIRNPNGSLNLIGTTVGKPGQFTNPDKDNFAPSVGFAYSPQLKKGIFAKLLSGNSVIRGGFRISYVNDEYLKSPLTLVGGNAGLGSQSIQARDANGRTSVRSSLTPRAGFDPLPSFTTLPTVPQLPISFAQFNQNAGFVGQLFGVDPNLQLGQVYEWNIGFQREIGFGNVLEVRYVGNKSNDLIRTTDYNEIDIRNNGFLDDFRRAQSNLAATDAERQRRINACVAGGGTASSCTAQVNTALPRSGAFNSAVPGTVQLPVFNQLVGGGAAVLRSTTYLPILEFGEAGRFAQNLIIQGQRGSVVFQPNPNLFISEIVTNAGRQNYNALQAEVRRRFRNGFSYQVNYTFQKTLTDVPNEDQNRQGELQDSADPGLNYGRPDYDRTHTLNANMILELPFGKGKRFLNQGGLINLLFGGFQLSSIINLSSGPPLGIIDPRGTSSIAFKSGRQSARSSLTPDEIKNLTGVFSTPNGRFFIDPRVLFATITNPTTGESRSGFDLYQPLPAGFTLTSVRGASPLGQAPFPGQVFFFNNAGETGNLPRNFINGLPYLNWDAGLSKNIRFSENVRLQLRAEAFNVLNKQVPFYSADLNVNSTCFGCIGTTAATSSYNGARVLQFGARLDF